MQDEILTETLSLIDEEKQLPEGWKFARLGDIADVVNGFGFSETLQGRKDLPFPFIKVSDMNAEGSSIVINYAANTVDETLLKALRAKTYPAGTVIFPKVGGALLTNKKRILGTEATFDNNIMGIVPKTVEKDWIYYWILTVDLKTLANTQALPSIRQSDVANLKIPLPPTIEEQRRIAAILDEQMKAVEQARLAVEAQRTAANLLPNAFLRVVFESEEAQNWQKRKLGEIAKTCSGSTPSRGNPDYYKGSISWVKTGELKDGLIFETEERISELALKETSVRLLPPETLLVAMYGQGQTRGRTGLLKIPATTNQACFAILPNETYDSYFLQYWFRHNYQRLRQETEGRGGNQPNLNGDVLNNQIVSLPIEVNEQSKFVEKINEQMQAAETLKKSLTEKLEAIKKLPAALLRKAFAGEI